MGRWRVPWSRSLCKMAMLNKFLRVSQDFSMKFSMIVFDQVWTQPMFSFSDLGWPRVLSISERLVNSCLNSFRPSAGFGISNWMHLSVGQVECKNHLSECTIHLSEIYKANTTYVKIRNMQSSIRQVLQVFHLSDCHFDSSQTIGQVKFGTLEWNMYA